MTDRQSRIMVQARCELLEKLLGGEWHKTTHEDVFVTHVDYDMGKRISSALKQKNIPYSDAFQLIGLKPDAIDQIEALSAAEQIALAQATGARDKQVGA